MEQATDPSTSEKKFNGKLLWVVLMLFLPVAITPIGVWVLISFLETSITTSIIILAATFIFLCWLIWLIFKKIVLPLQDITYITRHYAEGYLHKRYEADRNDEIGLLAHSLNQMAEKLNNRFRSLESKAECRAKQIRAIAEIAQLTTSDIDLPSLLQRIVDLVVDRFHHNHAAIYLKDETTGEMPACAASGTIDLEPLFKDPETAENPKSIPEWVVLNNRPWIATDVSKDNYYAALPGLPQTKSEAGVPISIGNKVFGVLDIHNTNINAFNDDDVATLESLTRQVALYLQKTNTFNPVPGSLQGVGFFYHASHGIAIADTQDEVLRVLKSSLQMTHYATAFFLTERSILRPLWISNTEGTLPDDDLAKPILLDTFDVGEAFQKSSPILVKGPQALANFPESIAYLISRLKYATCVLFPLRVSGELVGLLVIGETEKEPLEPSAIEATNSLVEITITALEKLQALRSTTQHLTELQTINTISQSISTETSLEQLYEIIHQQIIHAIGNVDFLVAQYDAASNKIEIPYLFDGEKRTALPPFPLGQGLISILIRTRQPLMIVEDTIHRIRALGGIVTDNKPAKSWLGVPLLTGGEVIGAFVIQDTEQEGRFDDEDLRLLTTLAAQVATAIRNTQISEATRRKAERDRQLFEISSRLRRTTDMRSILEITTQELGKALGARKAEIKLSVDTASQPGKAHSLLNEEEVST